ncbi:MAG: pilus assembly protein TadG-related protein [Methyloligellaceae bacterium]
MLFGLTVIPVFLMSAAAIDYGRAVNTRQHLNGALDSAALAVGAWTGLPEAEVQQKAQEYFDANFAGNSVGTVSPLSVTVSDAIITLSATARVDTLILTIAGINHLDVGATTEVTKTQKNIELVMALDNTGSMSWSGKIDTLKTASHELVLAMFGQETVSQYVKIGLVPFAAAVNIGPDKLGSGWIDETAQSSLATEDFQAGVNVLDLYTQITNRAWNGCVRARPAPHDTADTAPSIGTPDTLWMPYFAPDEPDFSGYANRYASDSGYSGDPDDYDARQRYAGKYSGLTLSSWEDDGPDFNCRMPAVTPMVNVKSQIDSAIEAMTATGNTVIPAGLAWAWRLVSPSEPFTEGVAYDDEETIKAIVLLTDGRNDIGGGLSNHNRSYYSAYGFAQSGHVGAVDGGDAETVLNTKTATLCTGIKAQNVLLYTITFQLADGPIKDLLRNCATEPGMYYDTPTNEQLKAVFTAIAKGLNKLRISK